MRWTHALLTIGAVVVLQAPIQAQTGVSDLPVSVERIRAALDGPPPLLQVPAWSGETPTFRTEVQQPRWVPQPIEAEAFDPTLGLPSAGELLMGGFEKIRLAAVRYKRRRAERRARREVDEALAAFCAARKCSVPHTTR